MDFFGALPRLAEVPIIVLLAVVVLALAWTLTRALAFLPHLPNAIVDAMSQAGQKSTRAFEERIDELQTALREERERLDRANDEITTLKERLAVVDHDRQSAIQERNDWRQKTRELEAQTHMLDSQIGKLSQEVRELNERLAA